MDFICIHVYYFSASFSCYLCPGVKADSFFKACSHDRGLRIEERNGLSHHVRTHECAVSVVMLKERDEGGCNRCNLIRGNIHEIYLVFGHYREVCTETALYPVLKNAAVIAEFHIGERNHLVFFLLCAHVEPSVVAEIHFAVLHLAIWRLYEAQVADSCIYAE